MAKKKDKKEMTVTKETGVEVIEEDFLDPEETTEETTDETTKDCDPIPERAPDKQDTAKRFLLQAYEPERLAEVASEMVQELQEARRFEEKKKAEGTRLGGLVKEHQQAAHELADKYEQGGQYADVDVTTDYYYEEDLVVVTRADTDEVVESRALNPDERQMGLKVMDGDASAEEEAQEGEGGDVVPFPGDDGGADPAEPPSKPEVPS